MRATIVRIGASGAGALLAVGLLAVPPAGATGSGRHGKSERSSSTACFDTSGRTQGRSHSDPDGMSNGGADKPGCTGGFDADRDGNNGCGNDRDREDDNNGRCGRQKAERDQPDLPAATTTSTSTTTTTTAPATVSAAGSSSPAGVEAATATTPPQTEVLGQTLSQPSALARTGAGVGGLALLGGLLCGGGRLAVLARRFLRID